MMIFKKEVQEALWHSLLLQPPASLIRERFKMGISTEQAKRTLPQTVFSS